MWRSVQWKVINWESSKLHGTRNWEEKNTRSMYLPIVSTDETMNLWVIIGPADFIKTTGSRWRNAVQSERFCCGCLSPLLDSVLKIKVRMRTNLTSQCKKKTDIYLLWYKLNHRIFSNCSIFNIDRTLLVSHNGNRMPSSAKINPAIKTNITGRLIYRSHCWKCTALQGCLVSSILMTIFPEAECYNMPRRSIRHNNENDDHANAHN